MTQTETTVDRREGTPLHAGVWVVWAIAAVASVQLATSPTSALVVVAVAVLVASTQPRIGALSRAMPILLSLVAAFLAIRVSIAVLTTHPVDGTTILTLPEATLPRLAGGFTIGGAVDLDVLLRATGEAVGIFAVLTALVAFNTVVAHHELLRALPRAFHELGLVVTVAVAFLPGLVASVGEVREADTARTGGRGSRRHRWRRTLVPVLEGAIERALRLAESMDARGFARQAAVASSMTARVTTAAGLTGLLVAFGALVSGARVTSAVFTVTGILALLAATRMTSATSGRTRHRPRRWNGTDVTTAAVIALAPVGVAVAAAQGWAVAWDPSTRSVPPFDPATAVALLLLAAPVWHATSRTGTDGSRGSPYAVTPATVDVAADLTVGSAR